ncbi:MAG: lipopolysaccharide kinase InaA family protein [Immundisolibacter sp.]|uniref:lipopolysaccharide kinase InaA family protein n=1 Tax=Immundisolibacter sp. TaxID=1934948 RepID=UPI003EE419F8
MTRAPLFLALPEWEPVFTTVGLGDFAAWWALELNEVEAGNQRRGGWSAVCRHELALPDGRQVGLYIKRQEDHVYRSWRHPLRGRLTAEREFRTLLQCRTVGAAAAELVLYAEHYANGRRRGVLVTRELAGYRALQDLIQDWQQHGWPPPPQRRRLLQAIALVLRALHGAHREHNSLYPKHVMVHAAWLAGEDPAQPAPVALIDLEKSKWRWRRGSCARRDLDSLSRRSAGWSRSDRRRFLGYYLGATGRLSASGRRLWRILAKRAA